MMKTTIFGRIVILKHLNYTNMGSRIVRVDICLPDGVLTNDDLAAEFGRWESERIETKLGIRQRHIAKEGETAGDLGFAAAQKVLENYPKEKIDMLLLCTQSPDYYLPTTACVLQDRLGLGTGVAAFDFNLGCSGYIYGLAIAKSFISSGIATSVLLITAETYSKHIHPKDLANRTIFGDAATATIIEKVEEEHIGSFVLGTDGGGKYNLIVPNGCFRSAYDTRSEEKTNEAGDKYTDNNLFMSGPEIFNFTIGAVPKVVDQCLVKNKLVIDEIDYFIFHQANKFMIDYLRKKIGIPQEKFYANMLMTGNTVSSTIPIAYIDALDHGLISKGNKVMLCGFGVGYSWGAVVINV